MTVPPSRGSKGTQDPADPELHARLQTALGSDYELGGLLGRGGMAIVFVARDRRLERDVAVKALRSGVVQSRVAIERFEREAGVLARLCHPNILPVFAVGEGEGLMYMITPRIDGSSLRDVIDREGRLAPRVAARIGSEIAGALDASHRAGIVHRDVKPTNILLERGERRALLADFGIAKSQGDGPRLTAAGMLVGSPRYMSPEQMNGESDIDGRADVFGLGAVLFEMLTGRPAFDAASLPLLAVQRMTVDPPSVRTIEPSISTGLAAIVSRCLARERAERWRTAADLADALAVEGA